MDASVRLDSVEASRLHMTISITMTVAEWRDIATSIQKQQYHYVSHEFSSLLRKVIERAVSERGFDGSGIEEKP